MIIKKFKKKELELIKTNNYIQSTYKNDRAS